MPNITLEIAKLQAENTKLKAERKRECIAFAQWFRSGSNRNGRTEDKCWDLWQAIKESE